MLKKIIYVCLLVMILTACSKDNEKLNRIELIVDKNEIFNDGEDFINIQIKCYDKNNEEINENIKLYKNEELFTEKKFLTTKAGIYIFKAVSENEKINSNEIIIEAVNFEYKLEKTFYYDESENFYIEYEYDEKTRLIKNIWKNSGNQIISIDLYEYNEFDNIFKISFLDSENNLSNYNVYEYDVNNNIIKKIVYSYDFELVFYTNYEYDQNKNIIKENSYDKNNILLGQTEYSYEYDEKNYISKKTTEKYYYLYEYNENNNIIKIMTYNLNDENINYVIYEYDKNLNLIKENTYNEKNEIISWIQNSYIKLKKININSSYKEEFFKKEIFKKKKDM